MEGEAKEAMCAIPGMAKKGQLNPLVRTAIMATQ
jgi:hypothetical protein